MKANTRRPLLDGRRATYRKLAIHFNTTTEDEVLAALAQPRPFYAELTQ